MEFWVLLRRRVLSQDSPTGATHLALAKRLTLQQVDLGRPQDGKGLEASLRNSARPVRQSDAPVYPQLWTV